MERSNIRRRLRRLFVRLSHSRNVLETVSGSVAEKWMKELLFMLACRRLIMLGILEKELGRAGFRGQPTLGEELPLFSVIDLTPGSLVRDFEREEVELLEELEALANEPGMTQRGRHLVLELVLEAEQTMKDLGFIRHDLLRA